jgi:ABC-type glycerol-3-phosphate transport system permease component
VIPVFRNIPIDRRKTYIMKKKTIDAFSIINTILMLALVFVTIYPFIYIINVSLSKSIYVMQNAVSFWPKGFTLEWYWQVFNDPRIGTGYRNTILYCALEQLFL